MKGSGRMTNVRVKVTKFTRTKTFTLVISSTISAKARASWSNKPPRRPMLESSTKG